MQSTSTILMIRPACFFYNEETGKSNAFQNKTELDNASLTSLAQEEFNAFVEQLENKGVEVITIDDTLMPVKPDAIFPNNWISFHANGKVVTYPMESANRRAERRLEIIQEVSEKYQIKELIDLAHYESQENFLEGTGSMIFDRVNQIAYACLSPRTDVEVMQDFAEKMDYNTIVFHAVDQNGKAIYHTNVMMSVGDKFALVCMDSIKDIEDRETLIESFQRTGKELISISFAQMNAFAGNLLQVQSKSGDNLIVLSQAAFKALDQVQIRALRRFGELVPISIPTIEKIGGGSVRCMMAEVFLPRHQ